MEKSKKQKKEIIKEFLNHKFEIDGAELFIYILLLSTLSILLGILIGDHIWPR